MSEISIISFFDENELEEKGDGNFKVKCPCCGGENDGYGNMVLYVDTNTAYCFSSQKWFNSLELYALIQGTIQCLDGRGN